MKYLEYSMMMGRVGLIQVANKNEVVEPTALVVVACEVVLRNEIQAAECVSVQNNHILSYMHVAHHPCMHA